MIELLSPAGNFAKLKLALGYGADAVYAGVNQFSLRSRSTKEFNLQSFHEAIDYTHLQNKKLYVTINGFPLNNQIQSLKKHIKNISAMKPDAFIVSTPSVILLCKEIAPDIAIHVSTQANVLNYLDAKFYQDIGVTRIIAAREVSLKDLIIIKDKLPDIELEMFIHGSMCFAYSGRCLISSLQSGRLANRGTCANDCRFPYEIYAKHEQSGTTFKIKEDSSGTYILNSKDLNLSAYIDKIIQSKAISSLKIEGRTKSEYYVATTTRVYRKAIDDCYKGNFNPLEYQEELNTTKNRGFTDGYVIKRPFSRVNTQNHDTSIVDSKKQVLAIINEDESSFRAKGTINLNETYELVTTNKEKIQTCKNEFGEIFYHENIYKIKFCKIQTTMGKVLNSVHSGNENDIILPTKLPAFSFIRSCNIKE